MGSLGHTSWIWSFVQISGALPTTPSDRQSTHALFNSCSLCLSRAEWMASFWLRRSSTSCDLLNTSSAWAGIFKRGNNIILEMFSYNINHFTIMSINTALHRPKKKKYATIMKYLEQSWIQVNSENRSRPESFLIICTLIKFNVSLLLNTISENIHISEQ